MLQHVRAAIAFGTALLVAGPAYATCPTTETIIDELTCSSTYSGSMDGTGSSDLGGSCGTDCYSCGSPYAPLSQNGVEDVYSFECQVSGDVEMEITGMTCDFDIYILDDSCDPYTGCETGSTQSKTTNDTVTFTCTAGTTYYVVIEGYGYSATGPGKCSGTETYTLSFDVSASTGCNEDCDNGSDDDLDGDVDCDDSDCSGDPVCGCDADGDGYDSTTCTTGTPGTDCDDADAAINPGATETCNSVDDDCDGSVDEGVETTWYRDADGDGYGTTATTTTACSAPTGYVANSTDCDDSSASIRPGATETCNSVDDDCDGSVDEGVTTTYYRDADSDGYGTSTTTTTGCTAPSGYVSTSTDCNDSSATVYPGAAETCNSVDDDCDGTVDEGVKTTYYRDSDGDGYGVSTTTTTACTAPSGYVANSTDCNDSSATVYPGATETCNSVDDDCDGTVDEGVKTTYYRDADSDGYGRSTSTTTACSAPSGYVSDATDCDDTRATVNPAATETCNGRDDDCDGTVDEDSAADASTWYRDDDGDGYGDSSSIDVACSAPSGFVADSTDCDDTRSTVYPGAAETCNSVDDDCDGSVDEGVTTTYYRDADSDGYGTSGTTTTACSAPSGYVSNKTDCDDGSASVYPGAAETCNSVDDDCDGTVDEGVKTTYYADADSDGYGTSSTTTSACSAPSGYVSTSTDCNDSSASVYPGATEYCNSVDDDCDGTIDESTAADASTWYRDADTDGFGDSAVTSKGCSAPSGYVADSTDCDDADDTVYPGASEVCDGLDNDCDGTVDEGATGAATWYADADGDGYGDSSSTIADCSRPSGYVNNSKDCDDTDAAVHPAATELCNSIDDDCDGTIDEADASDASTWYADSDSDSYGDPSTTSTGCTAPTGYIADSSDCDDGSASIHPGAAEVCDGVDQDCDGGIDEGVTSTFYADTDADGYGDLDVTIADCAAPTGYVADSTDCDDKDDAVYPGATEYCNSIDDDCDGTVDEDDAVDALDWYADGDTDGYGDASDTTSACDEPSGYVASSTDCDDTDIDVHPGATEYCNSVDDDCDGTVDESAADASTWYADSDGDSYGASGSTATDCLQPSGYVADRTDCDDGDAAVNPGATEVCNSVDDDCDGTVDEDDASDALTWYADSDSDSYGAASSTSIACDQPVGYVADSTDCDDSTSSVNPGATEYCNSVDDDCDGTVDEDDAVDADTYYADADSDGYGDPTSTAPGCDAPSGHVADSTDCDDTDADSYPGASETAYDGVDQDCDGADLTDVDGDGHDADVVAGGDDCDDSDATTYPGAPESADGVDADCDGTVDEETEWYDDDLDGYTEDGGDCDDTDPDSSPAGEEVCDGVDQDCDGVVDNDTECYDDDGDGFTEDEGDCNDGDAAASPDLTEVDSNGVDDDCDGSVDGGVFDPDGDGYTESGGDCDPADPDAYPGAPETCDGLDNDCDKEIDEGTECYDDDGDGWTENYGDCDDSDAEIYSGADEIPDNGRDDDCDGDVDEGSQSTDDDGDGWSEDGGDCDDYDDAVNPDEDEVEDGVDNDCDGENDEDFTDIDADGYTVAQGDCNDLDGWSNPGAPEMCDYVDNNCNGTIDEECADDGFVAPVDRKCGCATGGIGGMAPWLMMITSILALRRRVGRAA